MSRVLALVFLALAGCSKPPPLEIVDAGPPVVSQDILVRPVQTSMAQVRHILVAWKALKPNYRSRMDPRAIPRDQAAAEDVVRSVQKRALAGEPFEALMREFSEDLESARLGAGYEVRPDGMMEPEFQALSLRLHVGEVGVCRTAMGYHVVKRIQ